MDDSESKPTGEPPAAEARRRPTSLLGLLAILIAVGLSAGVWYDARQRVDTAREELVRRLQEIEKQNGDTGALARQSQDALRELQGKVAVIDGRLTEARDQQRSLEAMYQELSRNRDEWQLAEIEQILDTASQQLQLSGNVRAALLALQLADTRLARMDRPQLLPVRRALARDIERLKAVQTPDLPGLGLELDALVAAVDDLPLAYEERAATAPVPASAPPTDQGYLARLAADLWHELRGLVVLRRVDTPEPPLLPPTQAYFLRENLRLRLLNARMALLARDDAGYRADLLASRSWITRYFDVRSKRVSAALSQIEQLLSSSLATGTPSISGGLEALRSLKSQQGKGS